MGNVPASLQKEYLTLLSCFAGCGPALRGSAGAAQAPEGPLREGGVQLWQSQLWHAGCHSGSPGSGERPHFAEIKMSAEMRSASEAVHSPTGPHPAERGSTANAWRYLQQTRMTGMNNENEAGLRAGLWCSQLRAACCRAAVLSAPVSQCSL